MSGKDIFKADALKILHQVVREKKLIVTLIVVSNILFAAMSPFLSTQLRDFVDYFASDFTQVYGFWNILLLFIGIVLRLLANIFSIYWVNYIGVEYVKNLRFSVIKKVMVLPERFFSDESSGKIMTALTYSVEMVMKIFNECLGVFLKQTILIVVIIGYLFYVNWLLSSVLAISVPIIAFVGAKLSLLVRKYSQRVQNSINEVHNYARDIVYARKIIKIFLVQTKVTKQFQKMNNYFVKNHLKMTVIGEANTSVLYILASLVVIPALMLAIEFNDEIKMSAGSITAYFVMFGLLLPTVKQLNTANNSLQRSLAALRDINSLLYQRNESHSKEELKDFKAKSILFQQVNFTYKRSEETKTELIFRDLDVEFKPNVLNILVGKSGSGKSSIVKLITKLYQPSNGKIYFDQEEINDLNPNSVRKEVSLVDQDVIMFNDTVKFNICFDNDVADDDPLLVDVLKKSDATGFVAKLENGVNSYIGESGIKLSGGQKQRIAVARAFYDNAKVVIFDEATASLDNISEQKIYESLRAIMPGRIVIVIAHRLSAIKDEDRVVVMSEGSVVQEGSHKKLLAEEKGIYNQLYSLRNS